MQMMTLSTLWDQVQVIFGAHQQTICIFMEMQWINSSAIHSDEFFNGPFEITEKDTKLLNA